MKWKIVLSLLATLGIVLSINAWNAHLLAQGNDQGAARVHGEWDQADKTRKAVEAQVREKAAIQRTAAELAARAAEQVKQKETERIAHETVNREQTARAALAAAIDRNRSLHTTIAQLNADANARLSGSGPQSCSAADVDAATAARTALGECSSGYTAVAGVADSLSNQVMGLQDYVHSVAAEKEPGNGF